MKLAYADKATAQTRVDKIHEDLKATNPLYARSCSDYARTGGKEGTARWDVPKQDVDADGKVIGTEWKIVADDRVRAVLTVDEVKLAPEWSDSEITK